MTATVSTLMRHRDISGVSGEGPIGTVVEFSSGLTAFHWDTDTPSVTVYTDVRHVLQLHGHQGASTLELNDTEALLAWYERLCRYLCSHRRQPVTCGPHPDYPSRIRLTFNSYATFAFWVALLDGSTDAAIQEEVDGELQQRWATPDGLVWLTCYSEAESPMAPDSWIHNDYPNHDAHDPRD